MRIFIHNGHGDFREKPLHGFDKEIAVCPGSPADDMHGIGLPGMHRCRQGRIIVEIDRHLSAELA